MKPDSLILSLLTLLTAGVIGLGGAPGAYADDAPGKILFKDTKSFAPVVFDHVQHKESGLECGDCHDGLFQKKQGSADAGNALTMKTLRKGQFCGACHDGSRAFSVRRSCKKCHQK